ncbi:HAD-IIIC family phosphatase [Methylorubrum salsuginis]|uniref:HAD-superfamily phosphatase, subfamily IIIC/FkbH-like domain-containing protein n=1 Tax=Methylorubrum salsuginis TaxID=414703 RepID=A0A1I4FHG9_9HYPH|nr:HAD-IIIC family phosphatase [Methylorubrum salsuginis]SFL17368.1 HAD-superfamily phosphatase, subfamily IIIC/FkbH-like domain-containing protein [Methylorubrum salsuginis]
MPDLDWLPDPGPWAERLSALRGAPSWDGFVELANTRLNGVRTNALARALDAAYPAPPPGLSRPPVRLAVLGSSTVSHLLPAIRIAGLRRGLWIDLYEGPYGAYRQDILDPGSGLHAFAPDEILLVLDAAHATAGFEAAQDAEQARRAEAAVLADWRQLWRAARTGLGCGLIQQAILPTPVPLAGAGEHRLPGSRAAAVARLNAALPAMAAEEGIDVLALDAAVQRHGLSAWHESVGWWRAKQEIAPAAAPFYGDLVARVLAARRGLSRKALVLDLDNTLWGGIVGDDGPAALVLGPGSAEGEAFAAFQAYARDLSRRGVVLAVVSKNDEANALEAFARHPEMVLKRSDIAAFLANWDDKAENLRRVAAQLNLGLDALVFADDNPFERDRVRSALPEVAVPELPPDPSGYADRIAQAGYFEALHVTAEDRARSGHYAARQEVPAQASDLPAYLAGLDMRLLWRPFAARDLPRIVQLVNKTNQFNLTTRRIADGEAQALLTDPDALTLRFRLIDRLADNGIVGVVIGRRSGGDLVLDTWLMSCRVIGRGVEAAMRDVTVAAAREFGAARLVGIYRPSPKNGMVRDLYPRLGFSSLGPCGEEERRFGLALDEAAPQAVAIRIEAEE